MAADSHELGREFAACGLPLSKLLVEMLDEHPKHRTERRGCGFTQATRFLSTYINQPRSPSLASDLGIFQGWSQQEVEHHARQLLAAGWRHGWRALDDAPAQLLQTLPASETLTRLIRLPQQIRSLRDRLTLAESGLLLDLLEQTITGRSPDAPEVPGMPVKPEIGSCSQAEEFFLEVAHGRIRRHGRVNTIVSDKQTPLMLEKINLGESHSAIVVSPVRINQVIIPPGSLCALEYDSDADAGRATGAGRALPLSMIRQARFLRLTTLAVPADIRRRAFSAQVDMQLRSDFFSPLNTSIEQLQNFAANQLESIV